MRYYVIGPDGSEFGPADIPTLNQWISEGRIERQTNLRSESSNDLIRAVALPALNFPVPVDPGPLSPQSQRLAAPAQQSSSVSPPVQRQAPPSVPLQSGPLPPGAWSSRQAPPPPGAPLTPMVPQIPGMPGAYSPVTPRTPQPKQKMKFGIGVVVAFIAIVLKVGLPILYEIFGRRR